MEIREKYDGMNALKRQIQKSRSSMNEYNSSQKIYIKYLSCVLILLFVMLICIPAKAASAATLELTIDGKSTSYTGKQVIVNYDGNSVNMKNTPGIVVSGTSYVSYKNVFGGSAIGAKTTYDSAKKKITITKYDKTIVMTVGSKTAYVNGTAVTMPGAPMKVKYKAQNVTKILVPTEFVAQALGYGYSWSSTTSNIVAGISPCFAIKYDGTTMSYTGTLGSVTVDGANIDVSKMPSIVIDGTIMVQAKKVFASKQIGATYTYTKADKTIVITKADVTITMTIGSKTAYINGNAKTLSVAPRTVKNVSTGTSYVMVPGSFVSTALGYNYVWDSTSKTSLITTVSNDSSDSNAGSGGSNDSGSNSGSNSGSTESPELSGDNSTTKLLADYQLSSSQTAAYNYVANVTPDNLTFENTVGTGIISSVTQYADLYADRETYQIVSTSPIDSVSSYQENDKIMITLGDTLCTDQMIYQFTSDLVDNIKTVLNTTFYTSTVEIDLNQNQSRYEVALSNDGYILTVTVYANYMNQIKIESYENSDTITFYGLDALAPTITESGDTLIVMFANTINGTNSFNFTSSDLKYTSYYSCETVNENDTLIVITKNSNANYYMEEKDDNSYRIVFCDKNSSSSSDSTISTDYDDLMIMLPSGVKASSVTDTDLYLSKQFKLTIPGDYSSFYKTNPVTVNNILISSAKVSTSNGFTIITVTTTSICGYKYKEENGYLTVKVAKPNEIYDKIVVLDPGHGGTDVGAIASSGIYEKDLNYKILYTIGSTYFNSLSDIKFYYTRITDTYITLENRVAFVKEVGADLFVSLHMNSTTTSSPNGTEVYYYSGNTNSMNGLTSAVMAKSFVTNLTSVLGTNNRGSKSNAYYVLKNNSVPAVLIELGFISNSSDLSKLNSSTYQKKTAKSIYDTIVELFNQYN